MKYLQKKLDKITFKYYIYIYLYIGLFGSAFNTEFLSISLYELLLFHRCYCGRAKSEHIHDSVKLEHPENFSWKPELHTCESKTNAYGEVIFQGTGKKTRAKV